MKTTRIFSLLMCSLVVNACNLSILFGDEDLGHGYYYAADGNQAFILYNPKKPYKGGGLIVIDYKVSKYAANDEFIVALSEDLRTEAKHYWVIDKKIKIDLKKCKDQKTCDSLVKSNLTGPLNWNDYVELLDDRKINLNILD